MRRIEAGGLQMRMWLTLSAFALLICLLVWFLQVTIIHTRYRDDSVLELERASWGISSAYGREGFESTLRSVARSGGYYLQRISESGAVLDSIGGDGRDAAPPQGDLVPPDLFCTLDATPGYTTYEVEDATHSSQWMVRALVLASWRGEREVLILCKSMIQADSAVQILNSRFVLVMVIVLAVAVAVALALANMFSKPIRNLTKQAEVLAAGDYTVSFPARGYREIRSLSNTLQMAAQAFSNTEKLRRDFIANISHDMRTPLTVIKAYAEMIVNLTGDDPVKRERDLRVIIEEAENLSQFVNDTLELSKLQSQIYVSSPAAVTLRDLAEEVLERFRYQRDQLGYTFSFTGPDTAAIRADPVLMRQALYNLVSNAVKFDEGERRIEIAVEQAGGRVRLAVHDHGCGIPADALPHVWNRYYVVDPFGKNKNGVGVGLAIAKEIFDLHGMTYGVDSEVGRGSEFWFSAPLWGEQA